MSFLRSGHLNDDWAYVRAMATQSEFPFNYTMRFAPYNECPVTQGRMLKNQCDKQLRAGPQQVDTLNTLVDNLPTRVLEHGNLINTELWGTAPFRARGDGHLLAPNASNQLMRMPITEQRCARPLSELSIPWNFGYIAFPNNAEWWRRGGESARLSPIYVQPVAFAR